jgi:hypothetical protein
MFIFVLPSLLSSPFHILSIFLYSMHVPYFSISLPSFPLLLRTRFVDSRAYSFPIHDGYTHCKVNPRKIGMKLNNMNKIQIFNWNIPLKCFHLIRFRILKVATYWANFTTVSFLYFLQHRNLPIRHDSIAFSFHLRHDKHSNSSPTCLPRCGEGSRWVMHSSSTNKRMNRGRKRFMNVTKQITDYSYTAEARDAEV